MARPDAAPRNVDSADPGGGPGLSGADGKSHKLGEIVANRIETKIMRSGWPVGQVIGSEPDLLEEHRVSRAVLREAIRLLEHHGSARMRRGPGGGLVVTRPDASAVIRSAAVYLDSEGITPDKLSAARTAIELIAVQLTAESINEDGISRLRAALEWERSTIDANGDSASTGEDIHSVIAQLSGNPAIQLFAATLIQLEVALFHSVESGQRPKFRKDFLEDHIQLVDAIVAGDFAVARVRMQQHLARVAEEIHPH